MSVISFPDDISPFMVQCNINPHDPRTWQTQASLKRELQRAADDAAWEGDMARAAALETRITALEPELDHELVVPF
tara:strand:- start:2734 stop:2961 length:228 start_codon:yes stop_codon:yes gene_type:complete